MNPSTIPWQPIRTLPLTDGKRITVKDQDGELHNVTVRAGWTRNTQFSLPLTGWISNDQLQ